MIGPTNTPYEHGFYFFNIEIPDNYPFNPPKVKYCTQNGKTRFNPNLYVNGKVCLSIINTWAGPGWTSCNTISTVLLSIQALVFVENPLHNEPGYEKDNSIKNTNYNIIITFSPSYLLRIPENKKYSWEDLKKIKQKIIDLKLNI